MLPKFDSKAIWENFLNTNVSQEEKPTLFMGVPTMYSKLLSHYDSTYGETQRKREYVKASISNNIRYFLLDLNGETTNNLFLFLLIGL
jgi:malonyl-CoA/methylmalonyl-CoA synthetase